MAENVLQTAQQFLQDVIAPDVRELKARMEALEKEILSAQKQQAESAKLLEKLQEERFKTVDERFRAADKRQEERFQRVDEQFKAAEKHQDERFKVVDEQFKAAEKHQDERFTSQEKHVDERFQAAEVANQARHESPPQPSIPLPALAPATTPTGFLLHAEHRSRRRRARFRRAGFSRRGALPR